MRLLFLAAGCTALALAQPALAQMSNPPAAQQHQTTQDPAQLRQSIQHDLEQAGYTNIQIAPEAFLVRAKDKQGHPVTMMIEPGVVTAVTNLGSSGAPGTTTPHSGGGQATPGTTPSR